MARDDTTKQWEERTPTTLCRTQNCGKFVNKDNMTGNHHFYCKEHLRCGKNAYIEGEWQPCDGCLNTFQENADNNN